MAVVLALPRIISVRCHFAVAGALGGWNRNNTSILSRE